MSDRATLLALAAKVEGLTGFDAAVSEAVLRACGWTMDVGGLVIRPSGQRHVGPVPSPLTSLDAAMTLATDRDAPDIIRAAVSALGKASALHMRFYDAATEGPYAQRLARHVTAAALRARAEVTP